MSVMPLASIPAHYVGKFGPDRWCLKHGEDTLSWGELERRSNQRARALQGLGVKKDDVVILALPNCNALYEWSFAVWKAGATPSMVSWRLPAHEFKGVVDLAQAKAIVAADTSLVQSFAALPVDYGRDGQSAETLPVEVATHWKAIASGGSTGRPKLIFDHGPAVGDPDIAVLSLPEGKAVLNPGPCYHNAPFSMTHGALIRGNGVVGMAKFDPEEAIRLIHRHEIAWVFFVPTMMSRIARLPAEMRARYDISCLEAVWHGAAPMPAWLKQCWIDWLGAGKIWEMYGGTERQGMTFINGKEWLSHRGSVGKPFFCELRILDEQGAALPAGSVGEIFLKPAAGPGTTYHYRGADARKANEGYESIGDFGWVDAEGYLYIADRRVDLILSGGANIYPAEIESALMEHPGVEVAVVIGLPDEDMGAKVHAIVKLTAEPSPPTAEELLRFLRDRLVSYKLPRSFEFTDQELRDDAGKVRRSQLREERIARNQPSLDR